MRLLLLTALLVLSSQAYSQTYTVTGRAADTVNHNPLYYASITLLRADDSVLENFTRTNEEGKFSLTVSKKGKYILMSVFPGFVDFVDEVNVSNDGVKDLGEIPMISRTHLMEEFVFTDQYAAIKVKGDTIEYVADSFKVKDNATVEELLKKLPGLQVDKDGNIKAHGQQVQKLLVDGEEFFTDDPAVVSKGLQAKAVDKVQVFDKKSEQAEFTGIDDGEVTRTVNLQLKDNMKKGYFGKAVAAGGAGSDQNYFENQLMVNAFKGKRKLSAFGIMANTGKMGLGWRDSEKFGGINGNVTYSGDGSVTIYSNNDDFDSWNGQYNGQGYPKAWTGGVHYSNKWNEDKHHLGGNYRYAKQNVESLDNTLTQYILPDSQYFKKQTEKEFKTGQRHKVDGLYEIKPDSLSEIRLTVSGNYTNSQKRTDYNSQTLAGDGSLVNNSDRIVTSDAFSKRAVGNLTWKQKFKKDRRTLTGRFSGSYDESESDGLLKSINTFTTNGARVDTVDQQKNNISQATSLNGALTYTEPITKAMSVILSYNLSVNNSKAKKSTFNKSIANADAYDLLDSTFSNSFLYNIVTHSGGASVNFDYKNLDFSFGSNVANTRFLQENLLTDTNFSYNVVNLFPKANLRYKISKQSSISASYNGSTKQPSIQQIQPIQDNTDPLNISIGNTNLTQEFRHSFRLNLHDYKMLSGRWIWSGMSFSFVDNAITRAQTVDGQGRQTYQYVNMDGNYNGWGYVSIGKRITKLNMRVGGGGNVSLSRNNNIINGTKNVGNYNSYTGNVEWNYESKDEKFEVGLDYEMTYNDNKSNISTQATSYWTCQPSMNVQIDLPWKIEFKTDVNWMMRQRTEVFDRNNNVLRWNAFLGKKFLKNDQLELKLSAYDILKQNLGFNRYATSNYITENNYNTIRRYFMLGLEWNFTKMGVGDKPEVTADQFIIK
ncbi:MAG: TonB-dependent receptor [Chitinophagales bacterium]|nr:TonB-dependent receptor [Chitinophagaceae bacterium]MCB9065341.1 TonB-dependent receptor [Chitinophagales bacterium]